MWRAAMRTMVGRPQNSGEIGLVVGFLSQFSDLAAPFFELLILELKLQGRSGSVC